VPLAAARRLRDRSRTRTDYARWLQSGPPLSPVAVLPGGLPPVSLEGVDARPLGGDATHVLAVAPGTEVDPRAEDLLGRALALAPEAAVITCDEDRGGTDPVLRPGPSPDRDAVIDPCGALCAVRRDLAGDPWEAVQRHGRVHVPMVLAHRAPVRGRNEFRLHTPPAGEPHAEIVIPFKDRPELLRRCLQSLRETRWARRTITVIDNGSTDPGVADVLRAHPEAKVRRDPRPFNFSALNNAAAADSTADVLVFLNNDTEVTDPRWLEVLVSEALRPGIGAVAPLLLHPDGRVQHAGAVVGIHGTAGHPFAGLRPDTPTPFGTADDGPRNWLAVTAGCLAIERETFRSVGGFDEAFTIAGQDVDLGIRLAAAGHRSLCTPSTRMVHDESASRAPLGHLDADVALSRERYAPYLEHGDPYYHPALTLERTDCSFR
jgi:GT2 family glycosyltransferase